jgi:NAD-dependent dihydropyrimidine dehydrogenase PreA subunit
VIDHDKCYPSPFGKRDCIEECPENIFEVRKLTKKEKKPLSTGAKFLVFLHGGKQAFVIYPQNCTACGACVTVCPKRAIKLRK